MSDWGAEATGSTVANEALMLRTAKVKTILIVEGPSDDKLIGKFVDRHECEIVIAHGRENLLEALGILRKKDETGVVCLMDADFSRLDGAMIVDKDIVVTEFHDIESSLFRSSAFTNVLVELGSKKKLGRLKTKAVRGKKWVKSGELMTG